MRKAFLLITLLTLTACAGRPTPIPDAESANAKIYSMKCGQCHSVPHPRRHTFEQWEHMVEVMEQQMKHREMKALTRESKKAILEYLKANGR